MNQCYWTIWLSKWFTVTHSWVNQCFQTKLLRKWLSKKNEKIGKKKYVQTTNSCTIYWLSSLQHTRELIYQFKVIHSTLQVLLLREMDIFVVFGYMFRHIWILLFESQFPCSLTVNNISLYQTIMSCALHCLTLGEFEIFPLSMRSVK